MHVNTVYNPTTNNKRVCYQLRMDEKIDHPGSTTSAE